MKIVLSKMLFIASVSAQFGKHVYVPNDYEWLDAQKHCRDHFTDLSPITTWWDEMILKNATAGTVKKFWIGLYRNATHWLWSGGGHATYIAWDTNEPDAYVDQNYVSVCWNGCGWNGWHNTPPMRLPFLCFNLILVEKERTWETAMEYCRKTHTALTSLASETEHLLAMSKIQQDHITERVWIGLRYVGHRWLWIDKGPLVYQAWPQGGDQDHQCPIQNRCGALTKKGLWENWDCQEKLNFICY